MSDISKFIEGIARFQKQYFGENPKLARTLKKEQKPQVLLIGCSDSRVDPALLTDCAPGDLFMVRNIANLVPPYHASNDLHGVSSALEYAICVLNVPDIIVLGHSHCGGIGLRHREAQRSRRAWVGGPRRGAPSFPPAIPRGPRALRRGDASRCAGAAYGSLWSGGPGRAQAGWGADASGHPDPADRVSVASVGWCGEGGGHHGRQRRGILSGCLPSLRIFFVSACDF